MKLSLLYCSCSLEPKTSAFHVLFSEEDDEKVATLLHSHVNSLYSVVNSEVICLHLDR